MPYLSFDSSVDGLALEVLVELSRPHAVALRAARKPLPAPLPLRAMIDTGTDYTSVFDRSLIPLGLTSIGRLLVNTASGPTVVNRYSIGMTIPDPSGTGGSKPFHHPDLEVVGMTSPPLGFDMLIGMDVLSECLLVIDGQAGRFTIAY